MIIMVDTFSTNFTIESEPNSSHLVSDGQEFAPPEASEQEAQRAEETSCCEGEGACLISWKPRKASVA